MYLPGAQGIAVQSPEAIRVNPVRGTDDPAAIGVADLVLFAVKPGGHRSRA